MEKIQRKVVINSQILHIFKMSHRSFIDGGKTSI